MKLVNLRGSLLAVLGLAAVAVANIGCGDSNGGGAGGAGGGGGGGGAGGAAALVFNKTFDSSVDGFIINNYCEMPNLGGVPMGDAGGNCGPGTAPAPTVTVEAADGNPANGSLKVTVTYTAYNQYVDAIVNPSPALDLTGKTLRAKVKLVSATGGSFPGGMQFHASTGGSYVYGNASGVSFTTMGTWQDLAFPLNAVTAAGWDPTMVVQIGIQFYSGQEIPGMPFPATLQVVFLIDTITA